MGAPGYYRTPTIHGDAVVFVSEDDLWTVPADGGVARRLTTGLGAAGSPVLSPDGNWLAFISRDEGPPEVYVMPADGGVPVRRTFLGSTLARVVGWSRDGRDVVFAANGAQPMMRLVCLFTVPRDGGLARPLPYGPSRTIAFGPRGAVIGRHAVEPAWWKRYRGGRVGQLWIERKGAFERLRPCDGNLAHPMWIGDRVWFHSDHEGIGNLYSCKPDGRDLRRHTHSREYYVRHPQTDGKRVVFQCGADLHMLDAKTGKSRRIDIDFRSPRVQRSRRFVEPGRFLEDYHPSPDGGALALTVRGKIFTMPNWDGAVTSLGKVNSNRHRLARFLPDGKRVVAITDEKGEESLAIFAADGSKPTRHLGVLPIGRAIDMVVSPKNDHIVLSNHMFELVFVDLAKRKVRVLDRSRHGRIAGMSFSPDGRWIAYGYQTSPHLGVVRLCELPGGAPRDVTRAVLTDVAPSFDPQGRFLYFISYREFNPVYDSLQFELGFPRGMRPYLVTLRKDTHSPFSPVNGNGAAKESKKKTKPEPVRVDFEGIQDRVVAFPVSDGRYGQILGIEGGAIYTGYPIEGALGRTWYPEEPAAKGTLEMYKFDERKQETIVRGVSDIQLSRDAKTLFYRAGRRLRAIPAGQKPDEKNDNDKPGRKSGWIDFGRVRVDVDPGSEWTQMFHEAWRLMRDHFWVEDMSGVDWRKVRDRYRPLIDRVGTRAEFSDLMWEMQGELGTSHCYEMGGDYRPPPHYDVGLLAADFEYDGKRDGYRITRISRGDPWDESAASPLAAPGLNVKEGDVVVAVGGRRVGKSLSIAELLVNQAGVPVTLTLAGGRTVTVKTLRDETSTRYRDWVRANREYVHKKTKGRCGYVHIPDMGPFGFSEFHRQYLAEVDREALLIDVRFNGGGHVSQLLLEKLARKRIGYDLPRYGYPEPYPGDSPAGPMVALTNEEAGSDGDIFSHVWKIYKLGPLVGKRTWGGVIGIFPRHRLIDGSVTTQPEFSFWFKDVGFGVENYGTEPDVDVDIAPHDYAKGRDPQLDKGLEILMNLLAQRPPEAPKFEPRPRLTLPELPKS